MMASGSAENRPALLLSGIACALVPLWRVLFVAQPALCIALFLCAAGAWVLSICSKGRDGVLVSVVLFAFAEFGNLTLSVTLVRALVISGWFAGAVLVFVSAFVLLTNLGLAVGFVSSMRRLRQ